jgi:hypothetical protein
MQHFRSTLTLECFWHRVGQQAYQQHLCRLAQLTTRAHRLRLSYCNELTDSTFAGFLDEFLGAKWRLNVQVGAETAAAAAAAAAAGAVPSSSSSWSGKRVAEPVAPLVELDLFYCYKVRRALLARSRRALVARSSPAHSALLLLCCSCAAIRRHAGPSGGEVSPAGGFEHWALFRCNRSGREGPWCAATPTRLEPGTRAASWLCDALCKSSASTKRVA